jgi:hypothetical protein
VREDKLVNLNSLLGSIQMKINEKKKSAFEKVKPEARCTPCGLPTIVKSNFPIQLTVPFYADCLTGDNRRSHGFYKRKKKKVEVFKEETYTSVSIRHSLMYMS